MVMVLGVLPQALGAMSTTLLRAGTYEGTLREAISTAQCLLWYPRGLVEAALTTGRPCGDEVLDTPVLLAHGYGHNRSGWFIVDRQLRRAGFTSVHTFNYNPLLHDVPEIAARLSDRIELLKAITGSDRVHVVGHSLGGIVLRWYVQEMGGDASVATAITIASPHRGTLAARAVPGRTARQLVPGSWVMQRLEATARPTAVRWVAYYSNLDALVLPSSSAKIDTPALDATNVLVKDTGHLAVLLSPDVAASIVAQLQRDPRSTGPNPEVDEAA